MQEDPKRKALKKKKKHLSSPKKNNPETIKEENVLVKKLF